MATTVPFRLPDLGEGLTEGQILRWLVVPGESVQLNQNIVEIETAKAAVELPSPHTGVVVELLHEQGATVDVGAPIISFSLPDVAADSPDGAAAAENHNGRTAVLVGYGPLPDTAGRRRRKNAVASTATDSTPIEPTDSTAVDAVVTRVRAKPPIRKLARDLGVDLATVPATGPERTVTRHDVMQAARSRPVVAPNRGEQRIAVTGVRKLTAQAMVASAFTAPHVTVFLTVDATASMQLISSLKQLPEFADLTVSPLLLVAKAVLFALRRHPELNSSWDETTGEIVVKRAINLGIAAATPRGLLVPVIADADRLSLLQLVVALGEVAAAARGGMVAPAQLAGGTFSISNIGVFGVDAGTPILPPGQGAILAVGTVAPRPWVHDGAVVPRQVATLSLSFDHRIVDGEQASKFLADVGRFLREPALAILG
ncbi:MAG: dihydrolipoamide acetyltransferase family protein [Mycobacteriales bacterium]